ncbi:hypothetical protein RhiirA5_414734 [Rhizophagus irregularis]|uniref:F-box domain-containing protein n=1 Tax=Rhizophagus irregularis TaxID=588596 RepID=A0A2N0P3I1_9GLOM|nr:hypothetical protein RhiirA5_426784 [Rhizophagus irregularis]PKC02336.1 hypothetical protein RhiirA5_425395 [Rhizophagus irregularis]PKC10122.1 hypothetical protein RhiirA5_414734 [Rhizophagus irregularis]UZO20282.1 hypothetical protein OCT59_012708 [Rhizophagus irregularis]
MSQLNKDILFLIFEELQDDSKSLFSCLMVNRLWCEIVIPILWRNPWCYDINYSNKSYLFIVIASYLSDDIKKSIAKLGIQLPSFTHQSLLFDYLSFCRSINVYTIRIITFIGSFLAHDQFLLQQEFYYLFMKKFPELKYLDMRSIRHQIFYFPEASLRFESLCELKCDTSIDSSYFYGLAQLCQYIQELIIINVDPTNLHGVVKLIEVQKNLKYFEWKDDHSMFDIVHASGPDQDFYNEVLFALEKNSNNITHLNFYFIFIIYSSLKVFPKFYRLKTLMTSFDSYDEEQLKLCTYRDLEIFKMNNCNLKAASIIIENSGGHLKKILIEPYELIEFIDSFSKNSFDFIRNIHKFCPLIEFLSLIFFPLDMYFAELEKLLKTCHNLKSLLLFSMPYGVLSRKEILDYGENLLEVLIISTPINLKELRFCGNFEFSLETLEEFLERWEGSTLSILISNDTCEGEDYKKLINKYKDSKVIKDFRRESYENVIDMDFKL